MTENKTHSGRPVAADDTAKSADADLPAFLAKPPGSPVYHGFRILSDVVVEGFALGVITDFEAEESAAGDAFVVAPDNSRAGLVWEISDKETFMEICPIEKDRWGVWEVSFPFQMTSREAAKMNLQRILPKLKPKWEEWRRRFH